jgi:hypothetical protein
VFLLFRAPPRVPNSQGTELRKASARAVARARGLPRPRLFFARAPAHVGPSILRQLAFAVVFHGLIFNGWEDEGFLFQPFADFPPSLDPSLAKRQ